LGENSSNPNNIDFFLQIKDKKFVLHSIIYVYTLDELQFDFYNLLKVILLTLVLALNDQG